MTLLSQEGRLALEGEGGKLAVQWLLPFSSTPCQWYIPWGSCAPTTWAACVFTGGVTWIRRLSEYTCPSTSSGVLRSSTSSVSTFFCNSINPSSTASGRG